MTRHTLTIALLFASLPNSGRAAVAVLSNHTDAAVAFTLANGAGVSRPARLEPGESAPFFSTTPQSVSYPTSAGPRIENLTADTAYWFTKVASGKRRVLQLRQIGLTGLRQGPPSPLAWNVGAGRSDLAIRVILCVDEEEPTTDAVWQARLRKRLAAASSIVEKHSGVPFEAAGFAYWRSNNDINRLEATLAEFERAVSPPEGALAIGFSSQYRVERGRRRLGGTRGPLRRHILVKEWSPNVSEPERVELLVHELGHFLGAAHSPELTSVMRPVLGDRPVRLKSHQIRFDAINTLAIAMVGEEVRRRGVRQFSQISRPRLDRLKGLYATLAQVTPGEPAAMEMLRRLQGRHGAAPAVVTAEDREHAAAGRVVAAVTQRAAANRKRPLEDRLAGDALTNALVRAGAKAATEPKALLLGLGIALDDSGTLAKHPRTIEAALQAESQRQRQLRKNVLGKPTARDRQDTLKHFFVSAAMTVLVGEKEANLWGFAKELSDANGGSGFSFADLAADRAGVRFANGVTAGTTPLFGLAASFRIENYLPPLDGLEEGIQLEELIKRFGSQGDPRYDAQIQRIDKRIDKLPAYSLSTLDLGGL